MKSISSCVLLILVLVSCTTKTPKKDAAADIQTESDAKPVSPYTVSPCLCMKIYMPVCAGGVTYGNSCEAECHGHTSWKEDSCPQ